jgi:hypothetical protein
VFRRLPFLVRVYERINRVSFINYSGQQCFSHRAVPWTNALVCSDRPIKQGSRDHEGVCLPDEKTETDQQQDHTQRERREQHSYRPRRHAEPSQKRQQQRERYEQREREPTLSLVAEEPFTIWRSLHLMHPPALSLLRRLQLVQSLLLSVRLQYLRNKGALVVFRQHQ